MSDKLVCLECGELGVLSPKEKEICQLCGAEQIEPFRIGWDESD